jgi:DNA adenine methylase
MLRHVEPFVGGGAMFFARRPAAALLGDINSRLCETYQTIRDELEEMLPRLRALAKTHSQSQYYAVRERYNCARAVSCAERGAMFVYLNKTCFNGLHRVNRRGEFNVPHGRYVNPTIYDEPGLRAASAALHGIELRCASFESLLAGVGPKDFVYLDPPYTPTSSTAKFTGYAAGGFSTRSQEHLCEVFGEMDRRGCRLMLSNSDVPMNRGLYANYRVDIVQVRRSISCTAAHRAVIRELVIRNY